MLRMIRNLLRNYSDKMTGTSTVIIIRLIIEILESESQELKATKTNLMRRYVFSMPSIHSAVRNAERLKILDVAKDGIGGVGFILTINKDFANEEH